MLPSVPNLFARASRSGRSSFSDRVIRPDRRSCKTSTVGVCGAAWPSLGSCPEMFSANGAARQSRSPLPSKQQCCLRRCFAAGSSAADVLFSAKYDHLQVCAGVSIFIFPLFKSSWLSFEVSSLMLNVNYNFSWPTKQIVHSFLSVW